MVVDSLRFYCNLHWYIMNWRYYSLAYWDTSVLPNAIFVTFQPGLRSRRERDKLFYFVRQTNLPKLLEPMSWIRTHRIRWQRERPGMTNSPKKLSKLADVITYIWLLCFWSFQSNNQQSKIILFSLNLITEPGWKFSKLLEQICKILSNFKVLLWSSYSWKIANPK